MSFIPITLFVIILSVVLSTSLPLKTKMGKIFTVHNVFPAVQATVAGGFAFSIINYFPPTRWDHYPGAEMWKFFAGVVGTMGGSMLFVMLRNRAFRNLPANHFVAPADTNIGIRMVPGRRDTKLPSMTIFYGADAKYCENRRSNDELYWLPNRGDTRFNIGLVHFILEIRQLTGVVFSMASLFLRFVFRFWGDLKMKGMWLNAPVCEDIVNETPFTPKMNKKSFEFPQEKEEEISAASSAATAAASSSKSKNKNNKKKSSSSSSSEKNEIPNIILFLHGMGGHQNYHIQLCQQLVRASAPNGNCIVIAPTFQDGSSGFALRDENDRQGIPNVLSPAVFDMNCETKKIPQSVVDLRVGMLKDRVTQVERLMQFISDPSENGLAHVLFSPSSSSVNHKEQMEEKKKKFLKNLTSSTKNGGRIPIRLQGHSFGGATVVATTLNACLFDKERFDKSTNCEITSVTGLDVWGMPLGPNLEKFEKEFVSSSKNKNKGEKEEKLKLPKLLLIDSEEWDRWKVNVPILEKLVENWNTYNNDNDGKNSSSSSSIRHVSEATDHLTALDFAQVSAKTGVRRGWTKPELDMPMLEKWSNMSFF